LEPPFVTLIPRNKLDNCKGLQYGGTIIIQKPKCLRHNNGRRKTDAWNKLVMFLGVVDAFYLDEF